MLSVNDQPDAVPSLDAIQICFIPSYKVVDRKFHPVIHRVHHIVPLLLQIIRQHPYLPTHLHLGPGQAERVPPTQILCLPLDQNRSGQQDCSPWVDP